MSTQIAHNNGEAAESQIHLWFGVSDFGGFERPVPAARYAWVDFFRPDYDWMGHFDRHGQPDSDYLRNRIARLIFDLKTGEAVIDK